MAALLLNRQVELELSRKLLFRIQPGEISFDNQPFDHEDGTGLQQSGEDVDILFRSFVNLSEK